MLHKALAADQSLSLTVQSSIRLVNVARAYDPDRAPHQTTSLDWLQHQLDSEMLVGFVQRWNNPFRDRLPLLQKGAQGEAVMTLQQALNRWDAKLVDDGIFGTRTQTAVRLFQQQAALKVDGIVGVNTWKALFKPARTVVLSELLHFYNPNLEPQHNLALEWLQSKIPASVLTEFARRWRNQVKY